MNLNEAISILKSNNYICEFLNHAIDKDLLKSLIEKEFGLELIDSEQQFIFADDAIDNRNSCIFINSDKNTNLNKIKDKIANFVEKYGWQLRDILTNGTKLELDCPEKLKRDLNGHNLFMHISIAPPSVILKTGFRRKAFNRVYMTKIDEIPKPGDEGLIEGLPKDIDKLDWRNLDYSSYRFIYLIDLPKNIKLHIDPEFGDYDTAYFATIPIPPKYIKYLGYTEEP